LGTLITGNALSVIKIFEGVLQGTHLKTAQGFFPDFMGLRLVL